MISAAITIQDVRRLYPRRGGKAAAARRLSLASRPEAGWCAYCAMPAETWDHVDPWSRSRDNSFENLVPCCGQCNTDKGDLPLILFLVLTMPTEGDE